MYLGTCHCQNVKWKFSSTIESVTACNCTLCRRYGALWAYGHLEKNVWIEGETKKYERDNKVNGYHFCGNCGCICYYIANKKDENNYFRTAVNLRMISAPKTIMHLPIDHFDGLDSFDDLPHDGRCVKDLWF